MRRLLAVLAVALVLVGCSKKKEQPIRESTVCEPVRIAMAYIAMLEKPDAARTLLIGDGAKALEPYLRNAGTTCFTVLDGKFDLIVADCARMSKSSCKALRGMLTESGVVAWMMEVGGVTMNELHERMSDFELYDVHLWMPGQDLWLLVGSNVARRLRLSAMLDLFARESAFGDLAKAKCGTLPEFFASYAGCAKDFAPAFGQQWRNEPAKPEYFLTKEIPTVDWIFADDVDADILRGVRAEMRSMQVVRRLAVEGGMLSERTDDKAATTNAVAMLARAAKRNPNDLFIIERLDRLDRNARGFLSMGKILHAMKCYETMVLIQPDDAAAVHNFGMCLRKIGKTKLADEVLMRAETLASKSAPAVVAPAAPTNRPSAKAMPSGDRYKKPAR